MKRHLHIVHDDDELGPCVDVHVKEVVDPDGLQRVVELLADLLDLPDAPGDADEP